MEVSIIENIQRAELNPIEEAMGYQSLQEQFGRTQEQLATVLGKSRSHLTNMLRLLKLPSDVQAWVQSGDLSMGQARALLTAKDPTQAAKTVIQKGLSVRETEKLVKSMSARKRPAQSRGIPTKNDDILTLEADLSASLKMNVTLEQKTEKEGKIVIEYKSIKELETVYALLWN